MIAADTERDERVQHGLDLAAHWRQTPGPDESLAHTVAITLAAEVARLDAVVTAVRRFHTERPWRQFDGMPLGGTVCNHCRSMWPCSTVITLDGRHHE